MCKYQRWFKVNQRWISAVQRWKSNVSEQRKSVLNSADSEMFISETALFSSETVLIFFSFEQRWFRENQTWSVLKQSWSALMFFMFFESALKNVKTMKQNYSALITSGTSTRLMIESSANQIFQMLMFFFQIDTKHTHTHTQTHTHTNKHTQTHTEKNTKQETFILCWESNAIIEKVTPKKPISHEVLVSDKTNKNKYFTQCRNLEVAWNGSFWTTC